MHPKKSNPNTCTLVFLALIIAQSMVDKNNGHKSFNFVTSVNGHYIYHNNDTGSVGRQSISYILMSTLKVHAVTIKLCANLYKKNMMRFSCFQVVLVKKCLDTVELLKSESSDDKTC